TPPLVASQAGSDNRPLDTEALRDDGTAELPDESVVEHVHAAERENDRGVHRETRYRGKHPHQGRHGGGVRDEELDAPELRRDDPTEGGGPRRNAVGGVARADATPDDDEVFDGVGTD